MPKKAGFFDTDLTLHSGLGFLNSLLTDKKLFDH